MATIGLSSHHLALQTRPGAHHEHIRLDDLSGIRIRCPHRSASRRHLAGKPIRLRQCRTWTQVDGRTGPGQDRWRTRAPRWPRSVDQPHPLCSPAI